MLRKVKLLRYKDKVKGTGVRVRIRRAHMIQVNLADGGEIEIEVTKLGLAITSHGGPLQIIPVNAISFVVNRRPH